MSGHTPQKKTAAQWAAETAKAKASEVRWSTLREALEVLPIVAAIAGAAVAVGYVSSCVAEMETQPPRPVTSKQVPANCACSCPEGAEVRP